MPPRSAIGVQQDDGTTKAIMLYNDDRLSPANVILPGWYNSKEKAEELLSLGHLSRLGEKISPEKGVHHSFNKPQPNTVIAYHSDRGDNFEPYFIYKDLVDFEKRCHFDMAVISLHVWADGSWLSRFDWRDKQWIRIKVVIMESKKNEYENK